MQNIVQVQATAVLSLIFFPHTYYQLVAYQCFKYSVSSDSAEKAADAKETTASRETTIDDVPKVKNVNEFVPDTAEEDEEETDRYRNKTRTITYSIHLVIVDVSEISYLWNHVFIMYMFCISLRLISCYEAVD